jgi:hypothetical protein
MGYQSQSMDYRRFVIAFVVGIVVGNGLANRAIAVEQRPERSNSTSDGPKAELPKQPSAESRNKPVDQQDNSKGKSLPDQRRHYTWSEIEGILETLRKGRSEKPSRTYLLSQWYDELANPRFTESKDIPEHCTKLATWRKEFPKSPTPLVVLAIAHLSHAWDARGTGIAATVPKEGWELFHTRVAEARRLLEQAVALGVQDGEAHCQLIVVAKAEGLSKEETRSLFDAGRKIDPTYIPMYTSYAEYLLPRWHGEPGDIETFAREVTEMMPGDDGLDAYARIAATIDRYDRSLLLWGNYDPTLLSQASGVLIKRYPDAPYWTNFAALISMAAQDLVTARKAREMIGDSVEMNVWGNETRFRNFNRWCEVNWTPTSEKARLWGSLQQVRSLTFAPNSRYIWTTSGDSAFPVHLMDAETRKPDRRLLSPRVGVFKFSFQPNQKLLAASSISANLRGALVWNVDEPQRPLPIRTDERCISVAISPLSPLVAVNSGRNVRLFDLDSQSVKHSFEASDEYVNNLFFAPDGKLLAVHARNEVSVWNIESGQQQYAIATFDVRPRPEVGIYQTFFFDQEQRLFAAARSSLGVGSIVRYHHNGQSQESMLAGPASPVMALSHDGKLLATARPGRNNSSFHRVEVWSVDSKSIVHGFDAHACQLSSLAFSADNRLLASGSTDGEVKIWSLAGEAKN